MPERTIVPLVPGIPQVDAAEFEDDPHGLLAGGPAARCPVFQTTLDGAATIVVGTPEGLRELFGAERDRLVVLNTSLVHDLFGNAVFNLAGDAHSEARRRLGRPLSRRALPAYVAALLEVTEPVAASWTDHRCADLHQAVRQVTLAMSARVLLGIHRGEADAGVLESNFEVFVTATAAPPGRRRYLAAPFWAGLRARRRLKTLFTRRIRSTGDHDRGWGCALPGLAHRFTGAAAAGPLEDHLLAMLIAARETTASLITWSLIELAGDQATARRVAAEARDVANRPGPLTDAGALRLLRAVIAEVQRLHSPNLLALRQATAPVRVCGAEVPAGSCIAYSTSAGHFDSDRFPEADTFRPGRFAAGGASPAGLWAFGGGVHACLGRPLAELMALTLLVSVLSRGVPHLPDGPPTRVRYRPAKAPVGPVPFTIETGVLR